MFCWIQRRPNHIKALAEDFHVQLCSEPWKVLWSHPEAKAASLIRWLIHSALKQPVHGRDHFTGPDVKVRSCLSLSELGDLSFSSPHGIFSLPLLYSSQSFHKHSKKKVNIFANDAKQARFEWPFRHFCVNLSSGSNENILSHWHWKWILN